MNKIFKEELHIKYKLLSYERAFRMLKNNMCITVMDQAVLELCGFKGNPQASRIMLLC